MLVFQGRGLWCYSVLTLVNKLMLILMFSLQIGAPVSETYLLTEKNDKAFDDYNMLRPSLSYNMDFLLHLNTLQHTEPILRCWIKTQFGDLELADDLNLGKDFKRGDLPLEAVQFLQKPWINCKYPKGGETESSKIFPGKFAEPEQKIWPLKKRAQSGLGRQEWERHVDALFCTRVCDFCKAVLSLRWGALCLMECGQPEDDLHVAMDACMTLWVIQHQSISSR